MKIKNMFIRNVFAYVNRYAGSALLEFINQAY